MNQHNALYNHNTNDSTTLNEYVGGGSRRGRMRHSSFDSLNSYDTMSKQFDLPLGHKISVPSVGSSHYSRFSHSTHASHRGRNSKLTKTYYQHRQCDLPSLITMGSMG